MTLSSNQARRYYDKFAGKQDRQGWYEDASLDWLRVHGRFEQAETVLEIGCGTGRFAADLRHRSLADKTAYVGADISQNMLRTAAGKLQARPGKHHFVQVDAAGGLPFNDRGFDRIIIAYVLDLLSPEATNELLREAHRVLKPGGLICLASLTSTRGGPVARLLSAIWSGVQKLSPRLVGGCRPIDLSSSLDPSAWHILDSASFTPWGVASQALIARRP